VIDPQRYIIDHRKRSKSLGQAAQINGRQSVSSSFLVRISARPCTSIAFSGEGDTGSREENASKRKIQ
jgi:hypothetical protein